MSEPLTSNPPAAEWLDLLLSYLWERGGTDLHLAAGSEPLVRVDGNLDTVPDQPVLKPIDTEAIAAILLDDADRAIFAKRGDVDFAFGFQHKARVRGSAFAQRGSTTLALRMIPSRIPTMSELGLPPAVQQMVDAPSGLILVTGPTGSGKSTTLYAALGLVNDGERSIITIEDPVESQVPGIKQMQVATKAGVTFAVGLRAMLRSDPDVIMVGEIRDVETAEIAIQSALTGHLVLSTLHTRDAPSAITRLLDMGVEPFMVSAAIDCVVAQRLARMLCDACKRPAELPAATISRYDLHGANVHEAVGCIQCGDTGYRGRIGLYEVMPITERIRALLLQRGSVDEIAAVAVDEGMHRMYDDGLHKVKLGLTTLAEIARVTSGH
jgi:type IV pilus assembly protein PilB